MREAFCAPLSRHHANPMPRETVAETSAVIVPATATDAASGKPTASLQKLFMVMAAALALAGLTVSAIVRIGRMRARRAGNKEP